jgi:hypothetical protein
MAWLVFFVTVALPAVLGIVVNLNRIGFERRLAGEMRGLLAMSPSAVPRPDVTDLVAHLPPPVERYRRLAVAERAPVRTLRLHHSGTFRMSPTGKALPIRGTQLFIADRCLPSPDRATSPPKPSPSARGRVGQVDPTKYHPSRSTRPSSLRLWALWCHLP